jgi:curved DNA-binding protein CbpA
MIVAWRSGSQQGVSRLGTVGLGGLFLTTPNPPATGSTLELLFEIAKGGEVRARAVVRNSIPGKGMGVKFVQMQAEHRSHLTQFLKSQLEAGNIDSELNTAKAAAQGLSAEAANTHAGSQATATAPDCPGIDSAPSSNVAGDCANKADSANVGQSVAQEEEISQEELDRYISLSEKSTHYQLLGVTADSANVEIKDGFYALARKFHPDRHMRRPEWTQPLQQLMGAITEAYNVLSDEKKRGSYDRKLILASKRTEAEETIDECLRLAAAAQRDDNIAGAIVWLRKCVNIAPEVPKYRVSLATQLATISHHRRDAVEHLQKAIELDQWNPNAYLLLGQLYEEMQLPWRAEPLYSKILEFDPDHTLAKQRLGRVESKEKKKTVPQVAKLFSKKT